MFTESTLNTEVEKIFGEENRVISNYITELIFHTKTGDIKATSVVYSNQLADYANNYSDVVTVVALINPFDYTEKLQPSRSTLEATLIMRPASSEGFEVVGSAPILNERFRARLPEEKQNTINGDTTKNLVENSRNQVGYIEISVQLTNAISENLRAISAGGTYGPITPPDLLKLLLDVWSRDSEGSYSFAGVDMVRGKNDIARNNIVIPQRVKLVELPKYIQEEVGGIYPSGIGWYLSGEHWYIYPLYDVTRFDEEKRTATIILANAQAYPVVQKSYRVSGDNLTIFSNTEPTVFDETESRQQNQGSGVRFVNASAITGNFGKHEKNKFTIDQSKNVNEVNSYEREAGDVIAPVSSTVIHSNPLNEFSKLAQNNTVFFTINWTQSNSSLIYPGMPVKLVYWNGEVIKELRGTVVGKNATTERAGTSTSTQYIQTTTLVVAVRKVI